MQMLLTNLMGIVIELMILGMLVFVLILVVRLLLWHVEEARREQERRRRVNFDAMIIVSKAKKG